MKGDCTGGGVYEELRAPEKLSPTTTLDLNRANRKLGDGLAGNECEHSCPELGRDSSDRTGSSKSDRSNRRHPPYSNSGAPTTSRAASCRYTQSARRRPT